MSDVHALSGAFAVGAVDDLERAGFERHLARCPTCYAEVESLHAAAAALADVVTATPPPALRSAVLAGISRIRPVPPLVVGRPPHRRTWVRRTWVPLLVAAVILTLVGVGGGVWQPWRHDTTVTPTLTEQVLQDPGAQRFTKDISGGATVTVVRSTKLRRAVILTEDMSPAPDGKVYQLWLQSPDRHLNPAGLMPPGAHTMLLEGDANHAAGAGVSLEPAGGSDQPTKVVALIDFQATQPRSRPPALAA